MKQFSDSRSELNKWLTFNLKSIIVFILLVAVSIGLAFGISFFGIIFGVGFMAIVIGVPALLYSIFNIKFGIVILFTFSFFLGLSKFLGGAFPLGVVLDAFICAMILGVVIAKSKRFDYSLAGNPISIVVWIWIIYNLLEFFNPMASREAWFFVIRGIALLMAFYFIVLEAADNLKFIKILINLWLALALLGALYGLFQEFHGLLPAEKAWVARDEFNYNLIYNWGRYRIFSFFSDPTIFGILMAFTGVFCIALVSGPFKFWYKVFLLTCAGLMLLAMVYAGTRTAYAMVPAGLLFYAMLTLQKKTIAMVGLFGVLGAFIIFSDVRSVGPFLTTNSLERIRSAFKPSEDASFNVRERNQAFIRPFIESHPMGAGLGSIGVWGTRFSPNSPISSFSPDSGYVRIAVDLGWIGLILYCSFFAVVLIVGIRNYYRMHDPLLKSYLAAILAMVLSLVIANYPQEALIQVPTIFIFYIAMALIVRLKSLDFKLKKQI